MSLDKTLAPLLKKPFGAQVHPFGEEQQRSGTSPSSQSHHAIWGEPIHQIHLPHSLRSGQIHVRPRVQTQYQHSWLLIDCGPSVSELLSDQNLAQLTLFFQTWAKKYGHVAHIAWGKTDTGWGSQLWECWEQQMQTRPGGQIIILSDLHGPMPKGAFWTRCCSDGLLKICQLLHPKPTWENLTIFRDLSHKTLPIHIFNPQNFEKDFQHWIQAWKNEQRKTGFRWHQSTEVDLFHLAVAIQYCVNLI